MMLFDIGHAPVFAGSLVAGFLAGGAAGIGTLRLVKSRRAAVGARVARKAPFGREGVTQDEASVLGDVASFLDHLAEMPVATWLEIGRSLDAQRERLATRATSGMILEATIAVNRLGVSAWYVSDAVETAAFLAKQPARRLGRRDQRRFSAALAAAELAALAVLARAHLPPIDVELLCEPFAEACVADTV